MAAVVEAVGLVAAQFGSTPLPAAEGQAGAPYVGEVLADSQLGGRADQLTEGHVTAAVRRANLALDEPGVRIGLFFLRTCQQACGQKGSANDE